MSDGSVVPIDRRVDDTKGSKADHRWHESSLMRVILSVTGLFGAIRIFFVFSGG
jgi:hypothetical protein